MKIGFEIHQQLATHKLFCKCKSELIDREPEYIVARRLRPTQSELGEIDRAALQEFLKGKTYIYEGFEEVCLVELDEEPPHMPNEEAIDIAIEIALLLNAEIVDEVHFMRKIVIDGSNTSGFQRTAIIALNGYIDTEHGRVRIPTICLEEEACRRIRENDNRVFYRLDRLGIPLIEISTAPDITSAEQAKEVAFRIGDILRATKKVRRGLGTIRQDINISVFDKRVEIKGVQDLNLIPKVVEYEVERQKKLMEIKEKLKERGLKKEDVKLEIFDVSEAFKNTKSKIIKRAKGVFALKLKGFSGLIGGGRVRLGKEFADYARVKAGVKGIFHSDELPAYGISEEEVEKVREIIRADESDAFVLVAERKEKAVKALEAVYERALLAFDGVVEETRGAKENGETFYMRPLPGSARMYPETDIPPIAISKERIEKIKANLPETFEKRAKRFVEQYNLSRELANQIARSEHSELFEELCKRLRLSPKIIANTLVAIVKDLKKKGIEVDMDNVVKVLELVSSGKLKKDGIADAIERLCRGEKIEIAKEVDEEYIRKLARKAIEERKEFVLRAKEKASRPLMGVLMRELRGKVEGRIVNQILISEIKRFLGENS